jgi:hypothetical protein
MRRLGHQEVRSMIYLMKQTLFSCGDANLVTGSLRGVLPMFSLGPITERDIALHLQRLLTLQLSLTK